jgi:A/G-specific adenine glycosylase
VSSISNLLIKWYKDNARDLPWRKDATPYNIWVSEIILQQTQMNRGVEYYQRFIEKYPNIYMLAIQHAVTVRNIPKWKARIT